MTSATSATSGRRQRRAGPVVARRMIVAASAVAASHAATETTRTRSGWPAMGKYLVTVETSQSATSNSAAVTTATQRKEGARSSQNEAQVSASSGTASES